MVSLDMFVCLRVRFGLGKVERSHQESEQSKSVLPWVRVPCTNSYLQSPLGLGALAGNPFGIDREAMAKELGFEGLIMNSLNGVGDRDFSTETMQWASMLMGHISRISEDLIIYSTAEFGFLKLSDAYSTGSSLMPQKVDLTPLSSQTNAKVTQKNSDSLELLRGKSGRVMGQMMGLMVTTKVRPFPLIPPKSLKAIPRVSQALTTKTSKNPSNPSSTASKPPAIQSKS